MLCVTPTVLKRHSQYYQYICLMSKIAKEVGMRIRKQREAKNFNQQDIAFQLGLTAGAYAKIERGETDPSITRLFEIAVILKTNVVSFIKDQPSESKNENSPSRTELDVIAAQVNALTKELNKVKDELLVKKKTAKKK